MATAEPIKRKKHIKDLCNYFLERNQIRNYLMIVMGTHTALRISDLLKLKVQDVYDISCGKFHSIKLVEQKTKKHKSIPLNVQVKKALELYFATIDSLKKDSYIFRSNRNTNKPISRIQAYRVIKSGAIGSNIYGVITCHSLRKSFGYHSWKDGIVSPVVLMELFNHSNYSTTKKYLGVTQDDIDKAYLNVKLF